MTAEFDIFKLKQRWDTLDYTAMLERLLPDGIIWIFDRFVLGAIIQDVISGLSWQDSYASPQEVQDVIEAGLADGHVLRRLLSCFGSELERLEGDAWHLVNITDPGIAEDELEDWERVLGLPESCFKDEPLTLEERQTQAHAKLFDLFKTTNEQFYIDYAATLGFDITIVQIPIGTSPRIMGIARMGVERMGGRGGYSILEITINSGTSDNELLKCAINKVKQAHVVIIWVEP